ncbi:hypothetical protein APHAL10511_006663 [Amanita phalloides]|nr:hypothetical protein APHAL10511_006663 [Amanita phalloides]
MPLPSSSPSLLKPLLLSSFRSSFRQLSCPRKGAIIPNDQHLNADCVGINLERFQYFTCLWQRENAYDLLFRFASLQVSRPTWRNVEQALGISMNQPYCSEEKIRCSSLRSCSVFLYSTQTLRK